MAVITVSTSAANTAEWKRGMARLARVMAVPKDKQTEILEIIGMQAQNNLAVLLSQPGQGRLYVKRHASGRPYLHRASAPGAPPATDSGRLKQSYQYRVERRGRGPALEVYSTVFYAPYLELGTRRMAPRPALAPAVRAAVAMLPAVIRSVVVPEQQRRARA